MDAHSARNCGITPAHAGKRDDGQACGAGDGDHPRTCGEKHHARAFRFGCWGSPPHMRGKEFDFYPFVLPPGITPAHAGKSHGCTCSFNISGDHPRTCGEKALTSSLFQVFSGSPPHMRGKVEDAWGDGFNLGITPAHAGKSNAVRSAEELGRDHPRTCGEKGIQAIQ